MDEIALVIIQLKADIVIITETWLDDSCPDEPFLIPGYNLERKDRCGKRGGGVSLYITQHLHYKRWTDLETDLMESIWITIFPKSLPRTVGNITIAGVYHPPTSNNRELKEHISFNIDSITQKHPYTGWVLTGDFNQFPDGHIYAVSNLKQVVKKNTRNNAILDKIYTSMSQFYKTPEILPGIGASDHNAVLFTPDDAPSYDKGHISQKIGRKYDKNEKALFAHEIQEIRWEPLYHMKTCEEQFNFFHKIITDLINRWFPLKCIKRHTGDKPWITPQFKELIHLRQKSFMQNNQEKYRHYRNRVIRSSKVLRKNFYASQVRALNNSDPKTWWTNIKNLVGLQKTDDLGAMQGLANIHTDGDIKQLTSNVNKYFQEISNTKSSLLEGPQENMTIPSEHIITVEEVEKALMKIKIGKSPGPDGIQSWMLRDFAGILCKPVASMFNSSLRDGYLPELWKKATIIPIPKNSPAKSIEKDLRPISLTCLLCKELERFVVKWIREDIKDKIDKNQFGNIKGCSTTHLLVKLLHNCHMEMDKGNQFVRLVFVDFSKAFDRVNHNILIEKMESLDVKPHLVNWIKGFLLQRMHQVKIGNHRSEWLTIKGSVPQGTIFGMDGFVIHVNDLKPYLETYKYVDDTTTMEVVPSSTPQKSKMQENIKTISDWCKENEMVINTDKTKEMIISSARNTIDVQPLTLNDNQVERVNTYKVVGVTVSKDLSWNEHIGNVMSKANTKLYFLKILRRSGVDSKDMLNFYKSVIRPSFEYAAPVWATSLPEYLMQNLEHLQKRAMNIIFPNKPYMEALQLAKLKPVGERLLQLSKTFFNKMQSPNDRLHNTLPVPRNNPHTLRKNRELPIPSLRTSRCQKSLIPYALKNFQ